MKPLGATGLSVWQSSYVEFDSDLTCDLPCGIWPPFEVFFYAQKRGVATFSVMTIHQMSFLVLWNVHSRPRSYTKTPLTAGERKKEERKKNWHCHFDRLCQVLKAGLRPGQACFPVSFSLLSNEKFLFLLSQKLIYFSHQSFAYD